MARERLSGSLTSSQNVPPPPASQSTTRRSGTSSRLPVKAKRPILGERTDNLEYAATPRQHVVKQPKSVVMPRLSMSVTKHAAPATPHVQFSPSASQTSTPAAGLNRSRPGHTPHPRRSSVGLGQLGNADESMLMDMSATDFLASESEASEADEVVEEGRPGSGRGIRGAGRLMTPENSQETRVCRVCCLDPDTGVLCADRQGSGLRKQASPPRTITRLPTPPSSQAGDEPVAPKSRVRPRPEPTPPRPSSFAQQQISSLAAPTHDASPNPRRKKSPRPDEQDAPRLQSPFPSTSSTPRMSAPPPPRNRMEVVITQLRKSVETSPSQDNSATPRAVALGTTKKKGRPSVRTPAASKSLSQSTSSKPSRKQQVPATAPPANRRKSTPRTTFKKISPPRTSLPAQKSKRVSGSRSRKSVWPAELKRMVGTLPKPIEPGSPSDDPLLLIADDEATWGTPVAPSRAKPSSSRSKTLSAARVIDFQKPSGSSSRLAPPPTIDGEPVQEYDVPLHGSEPDYYDDQPMWGNESDGGSDMDDVGNDTFVHVKSGAQPHLMLGEGRGSVLPPADIARLGSRSPAVPTITTTTPPRSPEHADSPRSDIATPAWVNERLAGTPRAASAATPRGASIPAHSSPMASIDAHEDNGMDNNAALEVEEHTQEEMNDNATAKMGNTNEEGLEESFLEQNGRMSSPGLLDAGFASSSPAQPLPSVFASTTPALSPVRSLRSIASSPFTAAPGLTKSTTPIHSPMAVRPDTTVPSSTAALIAKLDSVISPRVTTAVEHDQQDGNVDAQDAAVTASSSRASPLPRPTVFASSPIASPVQRRPPQSVASPIQPSSPITRPSAGGDPEPFGALGLFLTPASPGPDDAGPASPTVHTDIDASTTGAVPLSTTPAVSPCRQLAQWSSPTRSTTPLGCPPIGNAADDTRSHPSVEEEAQEEEEEESTTPTAPLPHELSVMSSPRVPKSPLPAILDARLEEDEHDNVDASIDCSEQADQPLAESTTPTAPVPARLASPVQYTSAFSPRFPSSLRMVQQRSPTPAQEADEAAVDPEYSPHTERVAQDQEEARPANPNEDDSSLADITLEGHSADWSLSDDVPSADVTLDGNSADWASSDDEVDDDQPVLPPSEEADITPLEVASHPLEANNGVQTEEREGLAGEALDSADVPDTDEAGQSGQGVDRQTSPEEADDEQDHQEAAEEEDSTDQTDHDEQSASESEEEAPQPSKKIILKVVTRGVVKLEPETESSAVDTVRSPSPVPDLRPHLDIAAETENALQRSTTPAYDPPTRRNVFPTPRSAASMYQALPTSPAPSARSPIVASTSTLAPVLPGSSNDIEGSPEGQEEALPAMAVHTSHRASRLLARSSQRDAEVDEAEQSIRVRSRPSLGDELAESDQSMRSVVEVSSFDPMAAARAAAILKMVSSQSLCIFAGIELTLAEPRIHRAWRSEQARQISSIRHAAPQILQFVAIHGQDGIAARGRTRDCLDAP